MVPLAGMWLLGREPFDVAVIQLDCRILDLAPLLTMLNSCSANVVVVNIDSGFKAGYVAALMTRKKHATSSPA